MNQAEFGEKVGLSKASISALESGTRNITDRHIMLLCSEFIINEEWLRHGTGEMFVQSDTFSLDEYAKKSNLTELEVAIMKGYMDLDRDVRETLLNHVEKLFNNRSGIATTVEDEVVATVKVITKVEDEVVATVKDEINAEVESYRQELEDEKKGRMLSAIQKQKESS